MCEHSNAVALCDVKNNNAVGDLFPWPYLITFQGEVFHKETGRKIVPSESTRGFLQVTLYCDFDKHTFDIHRLVMYVFGKKKAMKIRHRDGDKHNNCFDNLAYVRKKPRKKTKEELSQLSRIIYKNLEYLSVPGLPGIFVSKEGKVMSVRGAKKKVLPLSKNKSGYLRVSIPGRTFYAHHLVALVFMPNREPNTRIGFVDGDRANISVKNLFYFPTCSSKP